MSMKKWRQLVSEKAEVEQQNESILAAIKNNKINEELGQLSGEKLFKPITSRLDTRVADSNSVAGPEGQVPDYGMDEFDLNNPFDGDFRPGCGNSYTITNANTITSINTTTITNINTTITIINTVTTFS